MTLAPPRSSRLRAALAGAGLALLAALALGRAAAADAAPPSCPPATAPIDGERFRAGLRDARIDHGFLWRIERGGHASYLYGTIHVAEPEWMFPGPRARAAIAASDTVALELDVLDPTVPERLARSVQSRPGESLPEALERRIDRRMAAECLDPARWRGLAPEFRIAVLATMAARRQGFDPAYAIDGVLAALGRDLAKSVVSLETPESQMAALRAPTREATIEIVRDGLDDLDSGRAGALVDRLVRAWSGSDLATLEGYERWCDCVRDDAERRALKALLDDRNLVLAAKVEALHADGHAVFAAVGSLHMIGAQGLPAQMRARGFEVVLVVPGP